MHWQKKKKKTRRAYPAISCSPTPSVNFWCKLTTSTVFQCLLPPHVYFKTSCKMTSRKFHSKEEEKYIFKMRRKCMHLYTLLYIYVQHPGLCLRSMSMVVSSMKILSEFNFLLLFEMSLYLTLYTYIQCVILYSVLGLCCRMSSKGTSSSQIQKSVQWVILKDVLGEHRDLVDSIISSIKQVNEIAPQKWCRIVNVGV